MDSKEYRDFFVSAAYPVKGRETPDGRAWRKVLEVISLSLPQPVIQRCREVSDYVLLARDQNLREVGYGRQWGFALGINQSNFPPWDNLEVLLRYKATVSTIHFFQFFAKEAEANGPASLDVHNSFFAQAGKILKDIYRADFTPEQAEARFYDDSKNMLLDKAKGTLNALLMNLSNAVMQRSMEHLLRFLPDMPSPQPSGKEGLN